jgi:hypothetical protein
MDDCESLAWAMKKSVSSSAARSGDVDPEVSEGAALGDRPVCRSRGAILAERESGAVFRSVILLEVSYG